MNKLARRSIASVVYMILTLPKASEAVIYGDGIKTEILVWLDVLSEETKTNPNSESLQYLKTIITEELQEGNYSDYFGTESEYLRKLRETLYDLGAPGEDHPFFKIALKAVNEKKDKSISE